MKEGAIVLLPLAQADGTVKPRPAVALRQLPGFGDWLVCGISTQFYQCVAGFDETMASGDADFASSGLARPSVIRLEQMIHRPRLQIKLTRREVFRRDNYICQYCARRIAFRESTIDHVIPRSRNGKNHWTNCVTSCKTCNRNKGDRTPEEANMRLIRQPGFPTVAHFWLSDTRKPLSSDDWHTSWDSYVAM